MKDKKPKKAKKIKKEEPSKYKYDIDGIINDICKTHERRINEYKMKNANFSGVGLILEMMMTITNLILIQHSLIDLLINKKIINEQELSLMIKKNSKFIEPLNPGEHSG